MFAFDTKRKVQSYPGSNVLGFIYSCATDFLQDMYK